ncbi:MAG: response regulator [Campylobacterales bacterium]|nr:response regulator [Campylobacterales bacterium]
MSYNILIVEDEFLNAQFLEQVVEKLGHNVIGNVDSAKEALAIAKEHKIDFVFMDINLEGDIDGIQCSILLNHKQNIPTIYITAFGDSATIAEAADTNIYGYIIKPFNANDIEALLAVAIAKFGKRGKESNIKSAITTYSVSLGDEYFYDLKNQMLFQADKPIVLSKTLNTLLNILALHHNQVVEYDRLIEFVWSGKAISDTTIRDSVSRLRKELPFLNIESISGVGYVLKSCKDI